VPNRQIEDVFLTQMIQKVYDDSFELYGARKVWHALKRGSVSVGRCTVERLMRAHGLQGVRRGKSWKTTIPDEATDRPLDLVDRHFKAEAPNCLWVADFTYIPTWSGVMYVAFVMDVFNREIAGWKASRTMRTELVLDALEQAIWARGKPNGVIHHSDRGSQYLSITYSNRLSEAGFKPSVGSTGDSYDNAMAESVIGLYKTELINRRGPWKTFEEVEYATLNWVSWYNTKRLHGELGYRPPVEITQEYWDNQKLSGHAA
jgi:putative transposase